MANQVKLQWHTCPPQHHGVASAATFPHFTPPVWNYVYTFSNKVSIIYIVVIISISFAVHFCKNQIVNYFFY